MVFCRFSKLHCPVNEFGSRKVRRGKDRPASSAAANCAALARLCQPQDVTLKRRVGKLRSSSPLPLAQSSCHPHNCSGRLQHTNYHFVPTPFSLYSNILPERGSLHSQRKRLNYLQSFNESHTCSGTWISSTVNFQLIFFFLYFVKPNILQIR